MIRYLFLALLLFVPLVSCGQTGPGSCAVNTIVGNSGGGLTCLTSSAVNGIIGGGGGGSVSSVTNSDGTLVVSPTTGAVIGSLNPNHANTWTATQTFPNGSLTGAMMANNTVTNTQLAQMPLQTVKCNNTGAAANASDCTTITLSSYTTLTTSNWFSGNTPPVNISRLQDRLFVGGATAAAGANVSFEPDWFSTFQSHVTGFGGPGYIYNAQLAAFGSATNANAATGILAASQSKNFTGTGNAIGITTVAVNNNTTQTGISYGVYSECHVTSVAHFVACFANEADPRSEQASAQPDPFTNAVVVGYQSACGAGDTDTGHPCGAAYQVVANPTTFNVGINFESTSVTSGAAGGNTAAIALPTGYRIIWYSSAGTIAGSITFDSAGNMLIAAGGCIKFNGTCMTQP